MEIIETNDGHFHRCEWLINNAEGKILDIGCSDGWMFRDRPDKDVTFLDKEYRIPKNYDLSFVQANIDEALPFQDNTFDTIVMGDILEHIENPPFALKEAYRVTKNKVIITVPNEFEWSKEKRPFSESYHLRFYDEKLLYKHLKEAGILFYEVFKISGDGWSFFCMEIKKK